MTVLCANCHAVNRDRAMFCIGCAGKLPAFAATGPSALAALDAASGGKTARTAQTPASPMARQASATLERPTLAQRGLLLAVLLLGATVLALAAWISFGPERSQAPGMASAAASLTPLPATPVAAPAPPPQVPVEAALAPGESTVPPPVAAPVVAAEAPTQASPVPTKRSEPQRVASASSASSARGAADPRVGCEDLFFVLAARCEANHCDQAAYTRHPRCTVVREQRRRDEARRNMTQ